MLQAGCCVDLAACHGLSSVCKQRRQPTCAPCAAAARVSWMLQSEAKSEVASCRDSWRTAAAPRTEYAAALQRGCPQLAPPRVTAAAVTLSCYGGRMKQRQPFCATQQQQQQHATVSPRTHATIPSLSTRLAYPSLPTCDVIIGCAVVALGTRQSERSGKAKARFPCRQRRVKLTGQE
jgi:hypothetical protein